LKVVLWRQVLSLKALKRSAKIEVMLSHSPVFKHSLLDELGQPGSCRVHWRGLSSTRSSGVMPSHGEKHQFRALLCPTALF
jgi:hypothetical protein